MWHRCLRQRLGLHRFQSKNNLHSEVTDKQQSLQRRTVQEPNNKNHKPTCTRRSRRRTRRKRRARLEVALNFFLALKEIKFHQHAESQLISKNAKTAAPQKARRVSFASVRKIPQSAFALNGYSSKYTYIYILHSIYIHI